MALGVRGQQRAARDDGAAVRSVMDAALRCLGRREHSRRELERKLVTKGHARADVSDALDRLAEQDLQSDARFVETYCRARTLKGYGPLKIRQELASRGIDEADLEHALTASADFWLEQASAALAKRFGGAQRRAAAEAGMAEAEADARAEDGRNDGSIGGTTARDDWNAQARFLARRGYPSDLIFRVLGPCRD